MQTVVQNLFLLEAGGPGVGLWIVEKLTGQVHRTYHDGPGSPLVRKQGFVANAIQSGIDLAEVSQMDCFRGMLLLIFAKRDQSLSPIQITITQQFVAGGGIYEDGEVGKVTGGRSAGSRLRSRTPMRPAAVAPGAWAAQTARVRR